MNADNTNAMQEALAAAVKRMSNNNTAPDFAMPTDPISMLMSVIPKLFNGGNDQDDASAKRDAIAKEDLLALQGELQMLRKQIHRVGRLQEETLMQLREMQQHQVALSEAVLDLAATPRQSPLGAQDQNREPLGGNNAQAAPARRTREAVERNGRKGQTNRTPQ